MSYLTRHDSNYGRGSLDVSEEKYHMKTRELDNIIIQLRLEVAENTAAFKV